MGFSLSGPALARQPNNITFLELAQDIMRSNGAIPMESIENDTSKHGLVAASSINRALSRAWSAAHWDWRIKWIGFTLEDRTFMFPLPADYEWHMSGPLNSGDQFGLGPIEYETLVQRYPDLAYATPEFLQSLDISHLTRQAQLFNEGLHLGIPRYWGIRGSHFFVYPVPDKDQYPDEDTWNKSIFFTFGYYVAFKRLVAGDDVLPVPPNLNNTIFFLANAYFKQAFEYPDFSVDEQRGEALLRLAVNRNRQLHPESSYAHLRTNLNPWGPSYGP